jgi:predicted RNase H-like nuclease (RuvC/YqgF family)
MREKWDKVHYADGSTYGEKTIERAVAGVSKYDDPEAADGLDSMTEPTGAGGAVQGHTRLAEKNRLSTERIAELETKLEAKEERIAELEAELDRLNR